MYITVIYDICFNGDEIKGLNEYLKLYKIDDENKYKIYVWGKAKFIQGEYDELNEINIEKIELWKNNNKIILEKEIEKELIKAIKSSINDNYFYYETYDYGEIYLANEYDEEKKLLAKFFKENVLKNY